MVVLVSNLHHSTRLHGGNDVQYGGNAILQPMRYFSGEQKCRYTGIHPGKWHFMFGPMKKWGLPSIGECVTAYVNPNTGPKACSLQVLDSY